MQTYAPHHKWDSDEGAVNLHRGREMPSSRLRDAHLPHDHETNTLKVATTNP